MGRPGLNRRQILAGLSGLTVAGSLGFAALSTGADALASGADTRVRYWNLFSGGDGYNMIAMLDAFREANPGIDVKDSTLQWGSPFYTKLAMAAAGNRAPDLGVMHMGRVTGFSPGRLLDPWDTALLAKYGVREADFNPELWKRAVIDGTLYALPLDIHVQLCCGASTSVSRTPTSPATPRAPIGLDNYREALSDPLAWICPATARTSRSWSCRSSRRRPPSSTVGAAGGSSAPSSRPGTTSCGRTW